jgi:hypothetical protein
MWSEDEADGRTQEVAPSAIMPCYGQSNPRTVYASR